MFVFFFNDTATTEIYTLSLHDALPILRRHVAPAGAPRPLLAHIRRGGTPARALLLRRRDPRAVLRARCCVSTPRAGRRHVAAGRRADRGGAGTVPARTGRARVAAGDRAGDLARGPGRAGRAARHVGRRAGE